MLVFLAQRDQHSAPLGLSAARVACRAPLDDIRQFLVLRPSTDRAPTALRVRAVLEGPSALVWTALAESFLQ